MIFKYPNIGLSLLSLILFLFSCQLTAQIYVATDGLDTNPGTFAEPYRTITKAISMASPGDSIFVRGGAYTLIGTINISSSKSGTESSRYHLMGYKDERALLDFSGQSAGSKGITLYASYWHITGFDIKGAGDNGMQISGGSYNIVEFCSFYENRDTGLQLSTGASFNRIINCDSFYNADPPDYGDADGFAPKLDVGTGNSFYGCRAWGNCDDGWDGYMRGATDVTTTLESCWTWGNGYLKDGSNPGSQANGNGFKMGGGDNSNSEQLMHHFTLKNCLAFDNKSKGFDQNNNVGSMTLLNCTGYHNISANYRITRSLNSGQTLTVKNCVSYSGAVELGAFAVQETNSWMSPFAVAEDDFLTLDPSSVYAARNPDGSLPAIDFMNLAEGSDLIDAGVDVGLAFNGTAPDLGAFETGQASAVKRGDSSPQDFQLSQNYPNPFNPTTTIKYNLHRAGFVTLKIIALQGRQVAILVDGCQQAGEFDVRWSAGNLPSGIYFYRLQTGDYSEMKKMIVQR